MRPGELVAVGRTSDVYRFGVGAVVKVPRPEVPDRWVQLEAEFTAAISSMPVASPKVLDVTSVDGRTAIVFELIEGASMWELMRSQGGSVEPLVLELARCQRARAFARSLATLEQGGAVVNMASMAHTGAPNMAAYSASKAAVIALTKTAAKDLASASIRVNSVSPAFIGPGAMWDRQVELQAQTPSQYYADDIDTVADQMIRSVPLRRFGSLEEVAGVVRFLLSDDASYITGFDIEVSGGAG